jgi:hypothetical protein
MNWGYSSCRARTFDHLLRSINFHPRGFDGVEPRNNKELSKSQFTQNNMKVKYTVTGFYGLNLWIRRKQSHTAIRNNNFSHAAMETMWFKQCSGLSGKGVQCERSEHILWVILEQYYEITVKLDTGYRPTFGYKYFCRFFESIASHILVR